MATEYTETFDQILKDTSPQTPGIIRGVALRELRLACSEFFERSYAWTKSVESVAVPVSGDPVQIDDSDANTAIIGILNVAVGGNDLAPIPRKPSRAQAETDVPTHYYVTSNPDEFGVWPPLKTEQDATVLVALTPAPNTDDLPRQVTLKFYDAIVEGYLARVYGHPNKPYTAPRDAHRLRQNFIRRIGFYAAQRKQGFNNSQAWAYPRNWR